MSPACEKCWDDAFVISQSSAESQVEVYRSLVKRRDEAGEVCSVSEQRGKHREGFDITRDFPARRADQ